MGKRGEREEGRKNGNKSEEGEREEVRICEKSNDQRDPRAQSREVRR